jgi:hypothetical protein
MPERRFPPLGLSSSQTISRTNNAIIAAKTANAINGDGKSMDHDLVVVMEGQYRQAARR